MKAIGISGRLYALVGIALVAMLATGIYAIFQERSALLTERQLMLSSMTENANSIFAAYHDMETQGLLTREEAQTQAKQAVGAMRYQKVEYFFAFDVDHRIVFHPTRPVGQDLTDYQDSSGLYLYREFVSLMTQQGGGFIEYQGTRPGFEEQFPKLSHVAYFEPWGWGVATGVYMDDLTAMLWNNAAAIGGAMLVALLVTLTAAYAVIRGIVPPMQSLTSVMGRLASGENSVEVPAVSRKDEIGEMARAVLVFKEAAIEKLRLEGRTEEERSLSEAERARNENEKARVAEEDHVAISSLADGLSALASGDLTYRITAPFAPKTQKLKDDFNRTADQLEETMSTISGAIGGMRSGTSEVSQAADD
ncbi:cache domain-containing protein, partial [Mesorhizobium sp. CAU 1741]|uniref:cache domain-containing protein n=1 Tax=Mesorhizobium sp. CAU 1741 TaxID=3140366 RepID=UPI00325A6B35